MMLEKPTIRSKGKRHYINGKYYQPRGMYEDFVSLLFMSYGDIPYHKESYHEVDAFNDVESLINAYEVCCEYTKIFEHMGETVPETAIGFILFTGKDADVLDLSANLFINKNSIGHMLVKIEDGRYYLKNVKELLENLQIRNIMDGPACKIESVEFYENTEELYAALHGACNTLKEEKNQGLRK